MYGLRPVVLVILTACGSPSLPSGEIACGPGDACPDGMTCAEELCWIDPPERDSGPTDAGAVDASGPVAEHIREAEDYDQLTILPGTTGSAVWTELDDFPDAVGSYMKALPNDGINCLDQPPTDCGAILIYDLPEMQPGTYHLHLRSSSLGPDDDSVHFGISGTYIDFIGLPDGVPWAWRHETVGLLGEGQQLYLWVREDGAAIDRFVLSQSTDPPE
jgi:hypothetical protein